MAQIVGHNQQKVCFEINFGYCHRYAHDMLGSPFQIKTPDFKITNLSLSWLEKRAQSVLFLTQNVPHFCASQMLYLISLSIYGRT
jgi:hypothetical protein